MSNRLFHGRRNVGMQIFKEIVARDTYPQVRDRSVESFRVVRHRFHQRNGVLRIVSGDDLQHRGGVFHRSHDRADGVHGVGGGNDAASTDTAVRRLKSHHAAERARDAYRTSVVASYRAVAKSGRDRSRRTSRRPAGNSIQIPGIVRYAEAASSAGSLKRHFIQVQLAQEDRRRSLQAPGNLSVFGGNSILENIRRRCGLQTGCIDIVLERNGDAMQMTGNPAGLALPIAFARLFQGVLSSA